jgi:hypothetical protein
LGPRKRNVMNSILSPSNIEQDGWVLLSAEEQNAAHPDTFQIPPLKKRETLQPGDSAKLLFDIETKENGQVIDRGVDRMWVIVKSHSESGYVGILDNNPGTAENLNLHEGDTIQFGPEHVADIDRPPREYVIKKYGSSFFAQ